MMTLHFLLAGALAGIMSALLMTAQAAESTRAPGHDLAETWRRELRVIDLHQHVDCTPEHLRRDVGIMDAAGLGIAVNLSGGTITTKPGESSEFARNKALADRLFPGRFLHYMNLDYRGWDEPDLAEPAGRQVEEGHR